MKYFYRLVDKSGGNTAAIRSVNVDTYLDIELRQFKYRNNMVKEDHQAAERITNPMLGFKSFWNAQKKLIAGIETMHAMKKRLATNVKVAQPNCSSRLPDAPERADALVMRPSGGAKPAHRASAVHGR